MSILLYTGTVDVKNNVTYTSLWDVGPISFD